MPGKEPPETIYRLVENLLRYFKDNRDYPFRFITSTVEPGLWIAFDEFDPCEKQDARKISLTINPLMSMIAVTLYGAFMQFEPMMGPLVVSYTARMACLPNGEARWEDPETLDLVYPYEYEVALYCNQGRLRSEDIDYARLIRGFDVEEEVLKKNKALCYWLHGRPYARKVITLIGSERIIVDSIALMVLSMSNRHVFWADFSLIWDRFWQEQGYTLSGRPSYAKAKRCRKRLGLIDPRSLFDRFNSEVGAGNTQISWEDYLKYKDRVVERVQEITRVYEAEGYQVEQLVYMGETSMVSQRALELYRKYPDVFTTPEKAEGWLKWSIDDSEKTIESHVGIVRKNKYKPRLRPEDDPEVMVEDYYYY